MAEAVNILESIGQSPVVFDGAMGTALYERGVFVNACYDAMCLSRPELVLAIHRAYVEAGAEVVETNTFGANPMKLREHGLAERTADINRQAVVLARQAVGDAGWVGGAVGPCLHPRQMWKPGCEASLESAFQTQIQALVEGGVDLLVLETFCHLEELVLAARLAAATGMPVLASFTVGDDGQTLYGMPVEHGVAQLDADPNVAMIGLNCGTGPAPLYEALERCVPLSRKPFVAMPNAGQPQEVDGRMIYMTSPEYFASYAKKYIKLGVRGVGGCCGTTPAHIAEMAKAIRGLRGVRGRIDIRPFEQPDATAPAVPMPEKSKLAKRLSEGVKVASVELLPPKTCNFAPMLERAQVCLDHGVDAINIPDGPRASARVSPMISAIEIERRVGIETILHYCCRDRNLIGMQSDILGGFTAGLRNLLIVTGDPPKLGDYPEATGVFDVDSIGLTRVAAGLNHGRDVGGTRVDPPTALLLGVGANPCAVSPKTEMDRYLQKIAAGAEFVITQPVFDAGALLRFLDEADARGAGNIPVLAGVWPLASYKNAEFLRNEVPGVVVPDRLLERMSAAKTRQQGLNTGIVIAREICDRIADRVAGFQIGAPFGNVAMALAVLGLG